ncbi:MAG: hypothetical protein OEQ49_07320 [Myxococcales bacterium]|nr:hypothetical protein [Myxococcales bacterium]
MGCRRYWGCIVVVLWMGCGSEGARSGPALEPRPESQTCLALSSEMPRLLSETGCFADLQELEPGPDLIPYEVNSALWTDGAFKPRYMVVPPSSQIAIRNDGTWEFPEGSILIKMFGFEFEAGNPTSRRAVETRFMVLRDGEWKFTTYRWNEEGTDGERLDDELLTVTYTLDDHGELRDLDYLFPDQDACITCHGAGVSRVLGPKTAQLNRDHDYDGLLENQLLAMAGIGLFTTDTEIDPSALPRMANPQKLQGSLEDQARAYFDANCAHCHQPAGWASESSDLDLRYETPLGSTRLCDPMQFPGWEGVPRIAPGNPADSGVLQRFRLDDDLDDALRMPSLGSSTVDPSGARLISDWIEQLDTCP